MKRTTIAALLKTALAICALGVLFVLVFCLPEYLRHIFTLMPEYSGLFGWLMAYGCLVAAPVFTAMVLLYQVFDSIGKDDCFTNQNAKRFQVMTWLALGDIVVVAAMGLFLLISLITPPFLVLVFCGAIFGGAISALVFFALSGMLRNAAALKQDNDMTI